jgi:predicted regulator of Ras-like GTPase activity (Roadblock/LC7/MglB family)
MPEADLVMYEEDYSKVNEILNHLLADSNSKFVLLVDRSGQLISIQGETESMDSMAFASLSAGNYAATSELAKIMGEREFSVLFHQGDKESLHISIVAERIILVVVFDDRTTLGLVRLRVKKAGDELSKVFNSIFQKVASEEKRADAMLDSSYRSGAEEEIDKLFKE